VVPEPSGGEIAGQWTGNWTGTGIFYSSRGDAVSINFVQEGNLGHGRLVLESTGAAEAVPWEVRRAGMWGTSVIAKVSDGTVKLRHQVDERLFAVDLALSDDGERMSGVVKGTWPPVGLVLARHHAKTQPAPGPPQAAVAPPAPEPVKTEPEPQVVAMVPEAKPETKEEEAPARPKQEELTSVAALTAVHFDFDKADLRPDALNQLRGHAAWLKDNADVGVLIEGHCDEKGTAEYNVALGERRAKSVREFLASYGIAEDRITTVSYGKERHACAADTADCHEMNRRTEFRVKGH
jgi:peptidoglycan-associated lipoprotein